MPDWISESIENKRKDNLNIEKLEEAARFKRETLVRLARQSFDALNQAVQDDISLFNKHFTNAQKQLKPLENIGDGAFQVLRPYDPPYTLQVKYNAEYPMIGFTVHYPNPLTGQSASLQSSFQIRLNQSADKVNLISNETVITVEQASQEMLKYALEGLKT